MDKWEYFTTFIEAEMKQIFASLNAGCK